MNRVTYREQVSSYTDITILEQIKVSAHSILDYMMEQYSTVEHI